MTWNARTKWVLGAALVLIAALSLTIASSAIAAPTEPTLGLTALAIKINGSPLDSLQRHHIDGYLRTVISGSEITTIPLQVFAITEENLILLETTGTIINGYGGIAEGMSGSPIFVNDNGTDKLIGALSYGYEFTLGGTGLATPIEAMTRLEDKYTAPVQQLSSPVMTHAGLIDRVIIDSSPTNVSAAAKNGALTVKPLSVFCVGGVPAGSKVFAKFQKAMAARNVGVVAKNAVADSPGFDSGFQTDLVGGASVAALLTRGDLWLGSIGTVTYGTPDTVLAYGHPAMGDGATSMYMTNALVDGVWPSAYIPFKMARPTAIRGEITQDHISGIMGRIGAPPAETPITADVTDADTGETTSTAVYVPSKLLDASSMYSEIVPLGLYPAAGRLFDSPTHGGSAFTTTTVEVSDGTKTYTITQPNVVDDSSFLLDSITYDAWNDVESLQAVLNSGVDQLHIVSVHLEARISSRPNNAQIVGIDVPGGIKNGVNHAKVSLMVYGKPATQTVDETFVVPAGVNPHGMLTASSSQSHDSYYGYYAYDGISTPARESVANIVDNLNSTQPNNVINLSFEPAPMPYSEDRETYSSTPITGPASIETSAVTAQSVSGEAQAGTPIIRIRRLQSVVDYGRSGFIMGSIDGPDDVGKVSVFGRTAGSANEQFLGYASLMYSNYSSGPSFSFRTGGLKANTTLRIQVEASGDGQWTSASASTMILARASVGLVPSARTFSAGRRITLSAVVLPNTTGGTITFQEWNGGQKRWRSIDSAKLSTRQGSMMAAISWKPKRGTHKIRATYGGGSINAAGSSSAFYEFVK